MTDARDEWLRERERKRAAVAVSSALGAYLLLFGVAALLSLFAVQDMADFSGPIIVRLGSPDGVDAPHPVEAERSSAQAESVPEAPAAALPEPPAPAAPSPLPTAKPAAAKPTPTTQPAPAPKPAAPPAPEPVVIRGSESGNSYDMTIMPGDGEVGRSLYEPIWLFMPLPNVLPEGIFDSIPDLNGLPGTVGERRRVFERFYTKNADGSWKLKGFIQPSYDSRPELWSMLEDAGYDVKNAEYKTSNRLRPVVILFKVSAPGPDGKPTLEAVHVEDGSGMLDIDNAVLYGFKKAGFRNSGSSSISGRFTYRF